ncbi:MAG TPA: 3-deoxy-D-manno-octulosonic acid transferase [Terracidiphilus sp.]|nr:3-deoxy-D-manno-octulosonic acid transferase [Terracidiphilus sp.]
MVLFFYNVALLAALVASAPWWLWRMATTEKYREGLGARLGLVPERLKKLAEDYRPVIWLHAVSVGEVLAVSRLVEEIGPTFPGHRLLISTTTRTGQALARERFGAERVFYCPLDLPWAVRTYLNALRPGMLVLAETEFWPNLLQGCFRRGIPVVVVNARISDRSWPRYQMLRGLWRPILGRLSGVLAQSQLDAKRLRELGCRAEGLAVSGNLKFDVRVPKESEATRLLKALGAGLRFVIAGSTLDGEEAALLETWPKLLAADSKLVMVVAPRHPERFGAVAGLLASSGVEWLRRSEWKGKAAAEVTPLRPGQVVLMDSIGELASVYSVAAVAFVGGSVAEAGGHNPLEPAQFGAPIVMGPHYANFRAITEDLRAHDAVRIATREELASVIVELLTRGNEARDIGLRAREVFDKQAGATARSVEAIREVLGVAADSAVGVEVRPA